MNQSKEIYIANKQSNQRLDKFLADFDNSRSRAAWQKIIKNNKVLVNKKTAEANYSLKTGDIIEVLPEEPKQKKPRTKIPDIKIIYEDDNIIVVDKPIGVVAQKADSSSAPAVTDFLENHFPPIKKIGENEQRSGIVHRLDKDTSGIMIAAKTQTAFDYLKAQFKNRDVQKNYTALVYGKVQPETGEINFALGRNPKMPCQQTIIKNPEKSKIKSRPARTIYNTLSSSDLFSLLSIELKTGRMHQIRVHMKAIGHPIVGDQKYAEAKLLRTTPGLKRQFLHATELKITLPNGKAKVFKSELPADLKSFLKNQSGLD